MNRTTPETLLISSLLNSGEVDKALEFGLTPDMLLGHRDEYQWVQDYHRRWGTMPTAVQLEATFPGFPFSEDETDVRFPAHQVRETYANREAMRVIMEATQAVREGRTTDAYTAFGSITYDPGVRRPTSLVDDPGYFEDYEHTTERRIEVPIGTLQKATNGIGPGELWYWAARIGQGKSHYAVDFAAHAAWKGARVMLISLEMTKRQCQVRYHVSMGHRLDWGDRLDAVKMLRREFSTTTYRKLVTEIRGSTAGVLDIHEMSDGPVTPGLVKRYCAEYDLVVVDYVGLMRTDKGQASIEDWRAAAIISNGLKEAVGSTKGRLFVAAQINREGDTNGWRPPKLKNLAQADAIGQDGDIVAIMKQYGANARVISLEKNRHGQRKLFWTNFLPNTGDFDEIVRSDADESRANNPYEEDD